MPYSSPDGRGHFFFDLQKAGYLINQKFWKITREVDMMRDGIIKQIPIVRRPLSKINEAIEDLATGRVTGRVVFQPDYFFSSNYLSKSINKHGFF